MLKIYNTSTKKEEVFKPLHENVVTMYSCGMTVNSLPHIGHLRRYLMSDILYRCLVFSGYNVKHVMNITDVGHGVGDEDDADDKLQVKAIAENTSPWDIAHKYEEAFLNELGKMNILKPNIIARATEHIPEMIDLVKRLEENGYVYETSVGLMYDTSKFSGYSDFAKLEIDKQIAGESTTADEERRNISDFALWIKNKPNHIMKWNSPWGVGYPGWHLECSAMSLHYLGESIDIHTGGIEHINVHHTNEIAQSEGATGKKFCNYWVHSGHLQVDNEKMSKSLGNVYGISDLNARGYSALAYRFMLLKSDYKKSFNFTWENIHNALNEYVKILKQISTMEDSVGGKASEEYILKFKSALDNDLNTSLAITTLHDLLASKISNQDKYATIAEFDKVLGLDLMNARYQLNMLEQLQGVDYLQRQKAQLALNERNIARKNKDFAKADEIRSQIEALGYDILDGKDGSTLELRDYGKIE